GTFSFTMIALVGTTASGTKTITEGVFNVTFSAPVSIPNAPETGNAPMTALVNGKSWVGAYKISASYQNNFLSMVVFDGQSATINFGIGGVTGPGTYSLAYGNAGGSSAIYSNGLGQGWGTAFSGGAGSITISQLTSNGVFGTFSFDAVPATGGATGTIQVTNGQFNIVF
ncbi:MAG TPA: hypothetical protein VMB24_06700, partial [Dehalococcoidales bacterium]|nr:hypothetical protein [Dehalococcoidales bacterium]